MIHSRYTQTRNFPPRAPRASATIAVLAAVLTLLPCVGEAAVEFVTPVNVCNKVDTMGDGSDLSVQAGNNVRFEVWGDGVDINPAVRVTADDGDAGTVTARIVRASRCSHCAMSEAVL